MQGFIAFVTDAILFLSVPLPYSTGPLFKTGIANFPTLHQLNPSLS
jgi:hypothetical protein